jgi:hypothetical protein
MIEPDLVYDFGYELLQLFVHHLLSRSPSLPSLLATTPRRPAATASLAASGSSPSSDASGIRSIFLLCAPVPILQVQQRTVLGLLTQPAPFHPIVIVIIVVIA